MRMGVIKNEIIYEATENNLESFLKDDSYIDKYLCDKLCYGVDEGISITGDDDVDAQGNYWSCNLKGLCCTWNEANKVISSFKDLIIGIAGTEDSPDAETYKLVIPCATMSS